MIPLNSFTARRLPPLFDTQALHVPKVLHATLSCKKWPKLEAEPRVKTAGEYDAELHQISSEQAKVPASRNRPAMAVLVLAALKESGPSSSQAD